MADFIVRDTAGLLGALAKAKGGDTVSLQAGTYSAVKLQGLNFPGEVTVKSQDASRPAVLTDFKVSNSSGLNFKNLEFFVNPAKADLPFQVLNSSNVSFDGLFVHGTLNGSSHDDKRGMIVRNSTDVSITNSRFEQLTDALNHLDSSHLTFSGNRFSGVRDNGIAGGGTSHLVIANNQFTNFDHVGTVHPDAIQVWTTGTKKSATDITITGNLFDRGTGAAVQGIWVNDETGKLPFDRVVVSGNTVVGAMYNGIGVSGARNATVANNTVVGIDGQQSWIRLANIGSATVTDNIAGDFVYQGVNAVKDGNVVTGTATAAEARELSGWLVANRGRAGVATLFAEEVAERAGMLGYVDAPVGPAPVREFVETVVTGTAGADRLAAGRIGDHRLEGGAGTDTLTGGGAGKTTMVGGAGDDTYVVKDARDVVMERSGGGNDVVVAHIDHNLGANVESLRMAAGGLTGRGNAADNRIAGSTGDDILYAEAGHDTVQAGAGRDRLHGGAGDDKLWGDDGDDVLYGDDGNDSLYGGAGADVIHGGAGNNMFEGGAGADRMYAGSGKDSFVFRQSDFAAGAPSIDTIFGFSRSGGDKIALTAIDANAGTAANDAFSYIGGAAFTGKAGQLRFEVVGGDGYLRADLNGDRVADFSIQLAGLTSIASGDIYL